MTEYEYEDIDTKLSRTKSNPDAKTHLMPNFEACKTCKTKACVYICPANVYNWEDENQILAVAFENCLECGACRIACEKSSIGWRYPRGKHGITFKHG